MSESVAGQLLSVLAAEIEARIDSSRVQRLHRRILAYPGLAARTAAHWLTVSHCHFLAEVAAHQFHDLITCGPQTYAEWHIAMAAAVGKDAGPALLERGGTTVSEPQSSSLHVHFGENQTTWYTKLSAPTAFPWQRVDVSVPLEDTWCWVWHRDWARDAIPQLVVYRVDGKQGYWWLEERYLTADEVTHWMPAQVPEPPSDAMIPEG